MKKGPLKLPNGILDNALPHSMDSKDMTTNTCNYNKYNQGQSLNATSIASIEFY
jgi:hypothetical protein